ncbi:hypothetical protein HDV04_000621 [Boothiomyces sp. JEL0838]|nr:hypothetical protein HDV04_000621 [Boothiomyces sp. JEL0838]
MNIKHIPVLLSESLSFLNKTKNQVFVDCTFGQGGYTSALLDNFDCKVIAIDKDPLAIKRMMELKLKYNERLIPVHGHFGDLHKHVQDKVDGILYDIGVSSNQLDDPIRGFSHWRTGPLDMRMHNYSPNDNSIINSFDPAIDSSITAEAIINNYSHDKLSEIFIQYGEERLGKKIASRIIKYRETKMIESTTELADLVMDVKGRYWKGSHPATKTFQALRIYINDELNQLQNSLLATEKLLKPGGVVTIVSFHQLEDRLVKRFFLNCINSKPMTMDDYSKSKGYYRIRRQVNRLKEEEYYREPISERAYQMLLILILPVQALNSTSYGIGGGFALYSKPEMYIYATEKAQNNMLQQDTDIDNYAWYHGGMKDTTWSDKITNGNGQGSLTVEIWAKSVSPDKMGSASKSCCWGFLGSTTFVDGFSTNYFAFGLYNNYGLDLTTTGFNGSAPSVCTLTNGDLTAPNLYNTFYDGNWHHYAASYNSSTGLKTIYVDGNVYKVTNCTPSAGPLLIQGGNLILGKAIYPGVFEGWYDEVRIWSVERTRQQIQQHMYAPLVPQNEPNLVSYLNFDNPDSQKQVFPDSKGVFDISIGIPFTASDTDSKYRERLAPIVDISDAPIQSVFVGVKVNRGIPASMYLGGQTCAKENIDNTQTGTILTLDQTIPGVTLWNGNTQVVVGSVVPLCLPLSVETTATGISKKDYFQGTFSVQGVAGVSSGSFQIEAAVVAKTSPGPAGNMLFCDGNYDYLFAPKWNAAKVGITGPYTVSAWIYHLSNSVEGLIGYSNWDQLSNNGSFTIDAFAKYGVWYHVAMVDDLSTLKLYIDGDLVVSVPAFGGYQTNFNNINGLWLCHWPFWGEGMHAFKGFMDEFRIYNTSISQTQIRNSMNRAIKDASQEANLVTYYNFDTIYTVKGEGNDTIVVTPDSGPFHNDIQFSACVPNAPPFCETTAGNDCIAYKYPDVPCYVVPGQQSVLKASNPQILVSSAPVGGYHTNQTAITYSSQANITITLYGTSNMFDPTLYAILDLTSFNSLSGNLYDTSGNQLVNGSRIYFARGYQSTKVVFQPLVPQAGYGANKFSYSVSNGLYTSQNTEISIDIYCPPAQYLNPTSNTCTACPSGTISLVPSMNSTCTSLSNPYGVGISATVAIGIVFQFTVLAVLILYRNGKIIRSSDVFLTSLIVLGYIILHIYTAFLPLVANNTICMIKPILLVEALTLIVAAGLIKHYRLYEIFFVNSFQIGKVTPQYILYMIIGVALVLPAVVFIVWSQVAAPTAVLVQMNSGSHYIGCFSAGGTGSYDSIFESVLSVYLILIAFVSLYLCYSLKDTAPAFIDFDGTLKSIYQALALFVLIILLQGFIDDKFAVDFVQGLLLNLFTIYISVITTGKILYRQFIENQESGSKGGSSKTGGSKSSRTSKVAASAMESQNGPAVVPQRAPTVFIAEDEAATASDQVVITVDGIQLINVYVKMSGKGLSVWEIASIYIFPGSKLAFIRKFRKDQAIMTTFNIKSAEKIDEPETERDQGKFMIYSLIQEEKKGETIGHQTQKEVGITIRFKDEASRDKKSFQSMIVSKVDNTDIEILGLPWIKEHLEECNVMASHVFNNLISWFLIKGDKVEGVVMHDPNRQTVILPYIDPIVLPELVSKIENIKGINGEIKTAEGFAQEYCRRYGMNYSIKSQLRVYVLDKPEFNFCIYDGHLVEDITDEIVDQVLELRLAFNKELELHFPIQSKETMRELLNNEFFAWMDTVDGKERVVSIAALRKNPTGNMYRVGFVYTLKSVRKKGYASSIVSVTTQKCFDLGCTSVLLYADMANPSSNSVYQKIGYKEKRRAINIDLNKAD